MVDLSSLRPVQQIEVERIFRDPRSEAAWRAAEPSLKALGIPDGTGGVNPGDRRAIFYLVLHLRARRVLKIGTHVGASTTSIACALHAVEALGEGSVTLETVDVRDVNDLTTRPWIEHGTPRSPREMIDHLGLGAIVRFVVQPAASFLAHADQPYDLIFLDGDHAEHAVYQEISAAIGQLAPGGVILLHDYFPDQRPLWSNGAVAAGPVAAVQRLRQEGGALRALPLGALPWPTKCASTVTSLAILARESS